MPHPDDEMEAWSLIENSTSNYKVFIYMTFGEETGYCVPTSYKTALRSDLGEIAAIATPQGKWTPSCGESRIASTLSFLNMMAETDSSIPSGMSPTSYTTMTLPANSGAVAHVDNGVLVNDSSVRIYNSTNGYGKVLFFNMGDGDLTESEVTWAIRSVKQQSAALGLPAYPVYNILGNFYHSGKFSSCVAYTHPDHNAIHRSLYKTNFGVTGYQSAATCAKDPTTARNKDVSTTNWDKAFLVKPDGRRVGHFQRSYGWLNGASTGWPHDRSATSQQQVFMRHQSFWQRY